MSDDTVPNAAPPTSDLRRMLVQRTLLLGALVALLQALALGGWAVLNTQREIEASRQTARAVAARIANAIQPQSAPAQAGPTPGGLAQPDTDIRHLSLVDARNALPAPAGGLAARLTRWLGGDDETLNIPLLDAAGRPTVSTLVMRARASSELQENAVMAAIAMLCLAAFGGVLGWFQYRSLSQALSPVATMKAGMARFEAGDFERRLALPPMAELAELAGGFNRLADSLTLRIDAQQRLSRQLLSLRADERQRLAREMHDEFGQTLSLMAANLALLEHQLARAQPADAHGLASALRADVAGLQQRVRRMLTGLRDDRFSPEMLAPDLRELWAGAQRHHPQVHWTVSGMPFDTVEALPDSRMACVNRVLQEGLTNAFRHARPVNVTLHQAGDGHGGQLFELVNDGLADDAVPAPGQPVEDRPRYGLVGMRERCLQVGAELVAGPRLDGRQQVWSVSVRLPAGQQG